MKILRVKNKNNCGGTITLEAAILSPVFICVIVIIAFFIRVMYIHNLIEHAMYQASTQICTGDLVNGDGISHENIKKLVKEYLKGDSGVDANERLLKLHIINGFDGLDFSSSRLLKDKEFIEIVVKYSIHPIVPFNIIPKVPITQSVVAKILANSSIWDLDAKKRGAEIQRLQGRNVPETFPIITKYDKDNPGDVTKIRSINLQDESYKDMRKVKNEIINGIKELAKFHWSDYPLNNINSEITSRRLVIFFPEIEESEGVRKAIKECEDCASEKGVLLEVKHGYGK